MGVKRRMTTELEESGTEDSMAVDDAIRFLWWNTSLSPPGTTTRSTPEQIAFVVRQLGLARLIYGWDVLGLCEVNDSDVAEIIKGLGELELSSVDMEKPPGKAVNDTALVFDRSKLRLLNDVSLFDFHGDSTLKAGHLATFLTTPTDSLLGVVVAHWPGRMFVGEAAPARAQLGMTLHKSLKEAGSLAADVVVMGDFNDDPGSPSLAHHLYATRDRNLALKKDYLLYNPFWRHTGESELLGSDDPGLCGTHYYAKTRDSHWFTYDQILFSPSFLGPGKFTLDERETRIVNLPGLTELITSANSIYDHYPVMATVKLKDES
jgi:hypothetical protein